MSPFLCLEVLFGKPSTGARDTCTDSEKQLAKEHLQLADPVQNNKMEFYTYMFDIVCRSRVRFCTNVVTCSVYGSPP